MPVQSLLRKSDYARLPYTHPTVSLDGSWHQNEECAIGDHGDSTLRCRLSNVSLVHGIFTRHEWSGKIQVTVVDARGVQVHADVYDLYSRYQHVQPHKLVELPTRMDLEIRIAPVARNRFSNGCEIVFHGLLLKKEEHSRKPAEPALKEFARIESASDFAQLQARMVDNWTQSLTDRWGERGVDPVVSERFHAYSTRIRECLVYANPGDRVLDVGAGFIDPGLWGSVIQPSKVEYWTQDIDPRVVDHLKATTKGLGLDPERNRLGDNTSFDFPECHFDVVFSSHCIEHSLNLHRTFAEILRILRPGGYFFFAVPIGWDESDEHLWALDAEDWTHLTAASGFGLVNQHVGNFYTGGGDCDLVVVAQKPHA